ncbi:hypothetical protein RHS03_05293, partial [Rhizoctonia solani]
MNVSTYAVAPCTHFPQHNGLIGALDRLFREHRAPPAIVQHSFSDRRPANHYEEFVYIITPFLIRPTSELLEDIGRTIAPAQARFTTLLSSHLSPVFPPPPVSTLYAPPNEENFVVARSRLHLADVHTGNTVPGGFQSTFESTMTIQSAESNQIRSTLSGSYIVKSCSKNPNNATLTIVCPQVILRHSTNSNRHSYALHSLSATVRQDPNVPLGCTIAPHFAPRDPRFERTCNGLRYECTWVWEVLDKELRANGFTGCDDRHMPGTAVGSNNNESGAAAVKSGSVTHGNTEPIARACFRQRSATIPNGCPKSPLFEPPAESIVVNVPVSSSTSTIHPLCVTFVATLTSAPGLEAIDAIHRSSQWADPQAREDLQNAFDKAHPAVQVVHHVVRVEIPDVGEMVRTRLGYDELDSPSTDLEVERLGGPEIGVYAHRRRGDSFFGELQISLDRDAGVVGRRGDEDEEDNSEDEE